MGLSEFFGWTAGAESTELPDIFPIPIAASDFIKTDIVSLYAMILTDVLERTHGLSDDQAELMFDNCVMSNSSDGLITLLAKAMAEKQDLFLVYEKAVGVIRKLPDKRQLLSALTMRKLVSQKPAFISALRITRVRTWLDFTQDLIIAQLAQCTSQ